MGKLSHNDILRILEDSGCDFTSFVCEESCFENIVNPLEDNNFYSWYETGATKLVIGFDCYDYVIKIPFEGERSYHDDCNYNFEYADDSGDGWDYCCAETLVYSDALREDVEDAFAKIELIGHVQGHPIYAQLACEIYEAVEEGASNIPVEFDWSKREETSKYLVDKKLWDFNTFWISQAREWYGDIFIERFLKFLENHVRDLHSQNLGYCGLQPVIIDYGGYNE